MHTQKRAAIYSRISKSDPRVPKVQDQEAECRRLAEFNAYDVVAVYVDDGISASTFKNRPGWQQLLVDIAAGSFDVLLAVEEERFTRQPMEKEILQLTSAQAGVVWHTVRGGMTDPASADGAFMSGLRGLLGRREVQVKSERQRTSNEARRMRGEPLTGVRPFGFETNRITHRPAEVAELRYAYETVLAGGTLYSIIKDWHARGIKTSRGNDWQYATLQQVLKRPRNAGLVEKGDEILEGVVAAWEPIVSREDWESVCTLLSDPTRRITRQREPRWLCAGLAICGVCGSVMRSSTGSDRIAPFKIYRCASKLLAHGDGRRHAAVKTATLDPIVRDAVISGFVFGTSMDLQLDRAEVADATRLQVRLSEIRQGRNDLLELVGTAGFDVASTAKRGAALAAEEAALQERLADHARRSVHIAMLVESRSSLFGGEGMPRRLSIAKAAELKSRLAERFDSLTLEQRRTLVRSLLEVVVMPGRAADRVQIKHLHAASLDAALAN